MRFVYNNPWLKSRRQTLRKNQTDAERLLWSKLRSRQLHGVKFFRQYSIGPYIIDFFTPVYKLAVELDGGQHTERGVQAHDVKRTAFLRQLGIKVIRFWDNEVFSNVDGVLEVITSYVTPPTLPLR